MTKVEGVFKGAVFTVLIGAATVALLSTMGVFQSPTTQPSVEQMQVAPAQIEEIAKGDLVISRRGFVGVVWHAFNGTVSVHSPDLMIDGEWPCNTIRGRITRVIKDGDPNYEKNSAKYVHQVAGIGDLAETTASTQPAEPGLLQKVSENGVLAP